MFGFLVYLMTQLRGFDLLVGNLIISGFCKCVDMLYFKVSGVYLVFPPESAYIRSQCNHTSGLQSEKRASGI